MLTTYNDALEYLYKNLPMFQRQGLSAYKTDLINTIELCSALDNPERRFKTIHVAGTNGKGSTSHMLASILQSAGYKTGLYTSPHLKEFTERIRINGTEIRKDFVLDFVNRMLSSIEQISPSFFEITVAMAFDYFAAESVDVAVIEVGLGGRLDSTNVITPELSVITNIGWDHQNILGDTLQKIASEKAGIIKEKIPVVISERQSETEGVFIAKASDSSSPLYFASDDYQIATNTKNGVQYFNVFYNGDQIFRDLYIPLQGYYQRKNLAGVLKAAELLDATDWGITSQHIVHGLVNVIEQTGLKGRWQKLGDSPLTICDTGHNVDGIREVMDQIQSQTFQKLHIVFGTVRDKDITAVLEILPTEATYYFCEPKIPRALKAEELATLAGTLGLTGEVVHDVNQAWSKARQKAQPDDMIFIGGSTFVVAEIENL
jgi:dihydrofolate synthase / folylpolyglutamate synthase